MTSKRLANVITSRRLDALLGSLFIFRKYIFESFYYYTKASIHCVRKAQ
ncbi:MAG TPA: hypothetical protein VGB79_02460 [Allosphingosinicella sp.]